jgi:hypothetical protein
MRNFIRNAKADPVISTILMVMIFYLSYRYPLQINSAGTSPTYSNTPFFLQVGKYVIALCACLFLIITRNLRFNRSDDFFASTLSLFVNIVLLAESLQYNNYKLIEAFIWPLFSFVIAIYTRQFSYETVDRYINRLFLISLTCEVVEVLLFMKFGRLPALAYKELISVRFGSFLDDPNGFAGLNFLFLGWAYNIRSYFKRWCYVLLTIGMIVLTQSLTAIIFLAGVIIYIILKSIIRLKGHHLYMVSITAFIIIGVALSPVVTAYFSRLSNLLYVTKIGSVIAHISMDKASRNLSIIIPTGSYIPSESWWFLAINNFGLLLACLYFIMNLYFLFKVFHYKKYAMRTYAGVTGGFFLFSLYFIIGSFNIPFYIIFPNNFLFFLIIYILMFKKITPTTQY